MTDQPLPSSPSQPSIHIDKFISCIRIMKQRLDPNEEHPDQYEEVVQYLLFRRHQEQQRRDSMGFWERLPGTEAHPPHSPPASFHVPRYQLEPSESSLNTATLTSTQIEALFQKEAGYNPAYNTFLNSLPCRAAANELDVRKWLRSWFTVTDVFDSDFGLDVYMSRIKIKGSWIQRMRKRDLIRYLVQCNRVDGGRNYDLDLLQQFGAYVWRAKIVYEVKRGLRRLDGKVVAGAEEQLEADAQRLERESADDAVLKKQLQVQVQVQERQYEVPVRERVRIRPGV